MIITVLLMVGVSLAFSYLAHFLRRPTQHEFELVPNCLVTKHPILFIDGYKSIFYFGRFWNSIPKYLYEHGYIVDQLHLPWHDVKKRQHDLKTFLDQSKKSGLSFHIIADSSGALDLEALSELHHPAVRSLTLATSEELHPISKSLPLNHRIPIHHLVLSPNKSAPLSPLRALQWFFVTVHNLFIDPSFQLNPCVVAVPRLYRFDEVATSYLRHAISLAESEVRCSH